jgi:hypothetical protein
VEGDALQFFVVFYVCGGREWGRDGEREEEGEGVPFDTEKRKAARVTYANSSKKKRNS